MRLLLLMCVVSTALSAQQIDTELSRFMGSPNGRSGTYAPFNLVLKDLQGSDTLTVRSISKGVVLERQVAASGKNEVGVVIPVLVAEGVRIEVEGERQDQYEPPLPLRRIGPSYARPYVAVFSTDPLYARSVLPSVPGASVCDYFELNEFFTDWRLFDGYDAIVVFNPTEIRLPPGSQQAIAEFCSLGGATVVVGSFRLGEKAVELPAPAESQVMSLREVQTQRFGYGPGVIFRFAMDELRRSPSAYLVLLAAINSHAWFGSTEPPAGKPESRVPATRVPIASPLPPEDRSATAIFWGLAGGLLLLCALTPIVVARYMKRTWVVQLGLLAGCAAIGAGAVLQERPLPVVEASVLVHRGEGDAASARVFLAGADTWRENLKVDLLDAEDRRLPRALPSRAGWRLWAVDIPLYRTGPGEAEPVTLKSGMVGNEIFRDYAAQARRGRTDFSTNEAFLLEWWLDENAYRGRGANLAAQEWPDDAIRFEDARLVTRGAIGVTNTRYGD